MAVPLPDDINTYIAAAIKVCDKRIADNQPVVSDATSIAGDKVERVNAYTAIKTKLLETYAL
jgi:hypothetical protein